MHTNIQINWDERTTSKSDYINSHQGIILLFQEAKPSEQSERCNYHIKNCTYIGEQVSFLSIQPQCTDNNITLDASVILLLLLANTGQESSSEITTPIRAVSGWASLWINNTSHSRRSLAFWLHGNNTTYVMLRRETVCRDSRRSEILDINDYKVMAKNGF